MMKKSMLLIVLLLAVAAGAVSQNVKLKMVVWDLAQTTYMQPMIDAYVAKHPNVSIEFVNIPANEYSQKLAIMLAAGDDSDLISVKDMPMYASMVGKSQLEPLDAYIKKDKVDLKQYSGVTDQIAVNKSLFALPYRSDIWILYYNKDLFDKAKVAYPTNDMTWDQYAALARKVSSGSGVDRVYGTHYHIWRSTKQLPSVQDGKNSIITTDYSFMKPYYDLVLGLQKDKTIMDFASLKVGNMHYSGLWYNEQIAMMPMGSWFIGTLISKIKAGDADMKWGIAKLPHPKGVKAGTTAGTITSLAINAKAPNKAAAWDFVKFYCGAEGAAILAKVGSLPAIRTPAVLEQLTKLEGFPADKGSAEALSTVTVRLELPMHPKAAIIEKILNEEDELIMTESKTVAEGLADMGRRVKEELDKK